MVDWFKFYNKEKAVKGQDSLYHASRSGLMKYDEMAKIINLPDDHIIVMMIVVGKAASPAAERGGQLSLDEVVFENNSTAKAEMFATSCEITSSSK